MQRVRGLPANLQENYEFPALTVQPMKRDLKNQSPFFGGPPDNSEHLRTFLDLYFRLHLFRPPSLIQSTSDPSQLRRSINDAPFKSVYRRLSDHSIREKPIDPLQSRRKHKIVI